MYAAENPFGGGVSPRFTRRLKGQSTVEYVLIIAIIVLVVLIAGPGVASAIRNQFNKVTETIDSGATGENFYDPVDLPDPNRGTAFAVYSEDDNSLMFYKRRGVPKVGDMFNYRKVTDVYTGFETAGYWFVKTPTDRYASSNAPWAARQSQIETVKVVDDGIAPKNINVWFANMTSLKTADVARLDTSECTQMVDTFFKTTQLKSLDLSSWDVSKTLSFNCMFQGSWQLKDIDMQGWSACPDRLGLFGMFYDCSSLQSLALSGFNPSSTVSANKMFGNCRSLSRITLGSSWKWVVFDDGEGTDSYLPAPSADTVPDADGKWYSATTGEGYAPADIPAGRADTYVASRNLLS